MGDLDAINTKQEGPVSILGVICYANKYTG